MITIKASAIRVATLPLQRERSPLAFAGAKVHILFGSHNTPHAEAWHGHALGEQSDSSSSPFTNSVETDTPIRLYTNRLLTQQGLVPLSLDHLALKVLRITPFLARGFCDMN